MARVPEKIRWPAPLRPALLKRLYAAAAVDPAARAAGRKDMARTIDVRIVRPPEEK